MAETARSSVTPLKAGPAAELEATRAANENSDSALAPPGAPLQLHTTRVISRCPAAPATPAPRAMPSATRDAARSASLLSHEKKLPGKCEPQK